MAVSHLYVSFVDALSGTTGQQSEKLADAQHSIKNNTAEHEEHNGPTQPDPDWISDYHFDAAMSGPWPAVSGPLSVPTVARHFSEKPRP